MSRLTLFFSLFLLCAGAAFAQVTPAEAAAAMGRGINLGNTLEAPNEGEWNMNFASNANFIAYKEAGFTNVRVPVRWDMHTSRSSPYRVDAAWMDRVEQVIDWGLAQGLYVTINTHHDDWIKQNYSPGNIARFEAIWRQIMARFGGKSDKLLYEMINEPNGLSVAQVNDLNSRVLAIIRAQEPTRIVIFGGNMYANAEQLVAARVPGNNDEYLMGYYHSYDPWPFAGEHRGTWGSTADYAAMAAKFQTAINWRTRTGIPVYISEFNARVEADFNSRMRWLAEYVGLADQHNFPFAAWDDNGWFKILNRQTSVWPETKDIFVHYYQDSPNRVVSQNVTVNNAPAAKITWNNRLTGNGNIIVERRRGTQAWTQVASLPADATEYTDTGVFLNNDYDWRMYTTRADGSLVHGYPTRLRIANSTQSSFNAQPQAIPGRVEPEDYDNGGEGVAYHDDEAANQGGSYRLTEGVDVGMDATGHVIGYISPNEWLEVTVNVAETGMYSVSSSVASDLNASSFEVQKEDQSVLVSVATPRTNGWSDYVTAEGNRQFMLEAGEQVLRIAFTGGAFNLDFVDFVLESTAVEDAANAAGFLVSPNPASDFLTVSLPATISSKATLELFTITGKKVFERTAAGERLNLDVSQLTAGGYVLRLTDNGKVLTRRVVVE